MDGDLIGLVVALLAWGGSALIARAGKAARKARQTSQSTPQQHDATEPADHWDTDEEAYEDLDDEEPEGQTLQEMLRRQIREALNGIDRAEDSSQPAAPYPGRTSTAQGEFVDDLGNPVFSFDQETMEQSASPFAAYQGYNAATLNTASASSAFSSISNDEAKHLDESVSDNRSAVDGADVADSFNLRQAIIYDTILHNENIDYLNNR